MRKIIEKIMKMPGAILLIPMLITAVLNSYTDILDIGNPTTAVFSSTGTMTIIGIMLVVTGIQMKLPLFIKAMKRGGILVVVRFLINVILSTIVIFLVKDSILGISVLAFVVAITSYNPGVYMAIAEEYGDDVDKANFALLSVMVLPVFPLMIMGLDSSASFDYQMILATIIPLIVGLVIGKLFPQSRVATKSMNKVLLPFLGACLGSSIHLDVVLHSSLSGIILFIVYMIVNWIPLYLIDTKLLHQKGIMATAICSVGGVSLSAPLLIASANKAYAPYVDEVIAQVSIGILLSAIFLPLIIQRIKSK
ncbi:2-keto-3-deoxygluconate permease [Breznakia sp. PF5-3]|uniref:2-keto-3-deoxygluconate permease n=1 Tax=unclassified Breznakia TaxID=2623764 RepID=UPI0024054E4A|nr:MULTISPECIES: 2-keto-3-deoxygluconate permease [unclassified Breznakia]MDF9824147.1 2-keto-3-deoxygluconate permease [Breznakia sp. PM6-1]MDF9834945.1 2-keto-3-deoxygluconate permease [Breznakia sp. PF5-3]MDF9837186.1 2-keto-3-deoxygluconate permease [Breznakia sp. PFB2-8]MDF9859176.1 2-keto-3-deoxygluconate permease [Breznakia sp. PH5-24]